MPPRGPRTPKTRAAEPSHLTALPILLPKTALAAFSSLSRQGAGQTSVHQQVILHVSWRTTRNPLLLFSFDGLLLFRFETRQFLELLFQLPPRSTRLSPYDALPIFFCFCLFHNRQNCALQSWPSMGVTYKP